MTIPSASFSSFLFFSSTASSTDSTTTTESLQEVSLSCGSTNSTPTTQSLVCTSPQFCAASCYVVTGDLPVTSTPSGELRGIPVIPTSSNEPFSSSPSFSTTVLPAADVALATEKSVDNQRDRSSPLLDSLPLFRHSNVFTPVSTANNYIKQLLWTCDGRTLITTSKDNSIRIHNLEDEVHDSPTSTSSTLLRCESFMPVAGGAIVEMDGHPVHSELLAVCRKRMPVYLFDVGKWQTVSKYIPVTRQEETKYNYSIAFNSDGSLLFNGYSRGFFVYDIEYSNQRPIQDIALKTRRTHHSTTWSSFGGIISAIAPQPFFDRMYSPSFPGDGEPPVGVPSSIVACGGFGGPDIALIDLRKSHAGERRKGGAKKADLTLSHPQLAGGGVTQVKWAAENVLVAGYRQYGFLHCWDVRRQNKPLLLMKRKALTNQRFQIDIYNDVLVTGDDEGNLLLYDLYTGNSIGNAKLHDRPCASIQCNRRFPYLATGSGAREHIHRETKFLLTPTKRRRSEHCSSSEESTGEEAAELAPTTEHCNSLDVWNIDWSAIVAAVDPPPDK